MPDAKDHSVLFSPNSFRLRSTRISASDSCDDVDLAYSSRLGDTCIEFLGLRSAILNAGASETRSTDATNSPVLMLMIAACSFVGNRMMVNNTTRSTKRLGSLVNVHSVMAMVLRLSFVLLQLKPKLMLSREQPDGMGVTGCGAWRLAVTWGWTCSGGVKRWSSPPHGFWEPTLLKSGDPGTDSRALAQGGIQQAAIRLVIDCRD